MQMHPEYILMRVISANANLILFNRVISMAIVARFMRFSLEAAVDVVIGEGAQEGGIDHWTRL